MCIERERERNIYYIQYNALHMSITACESEFSPNTRSIFKQKNETGDPINRKQKKRGYFEV